MRSTILNSTPNPAQTAITAARNDYMTRWVGDMSFEEVLENSGSDSKEEFTERLMERGHFGPLEHAHIVVSFEGISRVAMAQVTRHRHASFDVQSLRYTTPAADKELDLESMEDLVRVPPSIESEDDLREEFLTICLGQFQRYQGMLEYGIPAEEARFALPLSTKVNMVLSMNARSLLHVLDMRKAGDAQGEAQEMADRLLDHGLDWFPEAFGYYQEEMNPRKNRLAP